MNAEKKKIIFLYYLLPTGTYHQNLANLGLSVFYKKNEKSFE
jgi:hypothetical protein